MGGGGGEVVGLLSFWGISVSGNFADKLFQHRAA